MHEPKRQPWYVRAVDIACNVLGFLLFCTTLGCIWGVPLYLVEPDDPHYKMIAVWSVSGEACLLLLICMCASIVRLSRQINDLTDKHDHLRKKLIRLERLMDDAAADERAQANL